MIQPVVAAYVARPLECRPLDPRSGEVAQRIAAQVAFHAATLRAEHVGSSAVPGCAGTGAIDLLLARPQAELTDAEPQLTALGFQPQAATQFFADAKFFAGSFALHDQVWQVHLFLVAADHAMVDSLRFLRSCLRSDPELKRAYVEHKRTVLAKSSDPAHYAKEKDEFLKMILG